MKVLVTGGAGFIGSHLVDALLAREHQVSVIDNLSTGRPENLAHARFLGFCDVDLHTLDIADEGAAALIRRVRPDVIMHLAAQPSVAVSMRDPQLDARCNIMGLLNILAAARDSGCHRVVLASSGGTIYGEPDPESLPLQEDAPISPRSFYGLSKDMGGKYLELFTEHCGMTHAALALGNVYGPRQNPQGEAGVIAIFAQRILTDQPCIIFGDGHSTRDYVYVDDVVDAFMKALNRGSGLINVGTGVETSVLDIHAALSKCKGATRPPVHRLALPGEVRRTSLCADRASSELGWRPRTSLEAGISQVISWLQPGTRAAEAEERFETQAPGVRVETGLHPGSTRGLT